MIYFFFYMPAPEKGSIDWKIMAEAEELRQRWKTEGSHEWTNRVRRQALEDTDYVVQIYMIVDYYLYRE